PAPRSPADGPPRSLRGDLMTAPHDLPPAGPGAPTPPIALAGDPGGATARLDVPPVAVPEPVLAELQGICPVTTDPGARAEASRDWWPQAMIWALDGQVAALAGVVASPTSAEQVAA